MPSRSWRRLWVLILLVCGLAHLPALADFATECNIGCHGISGITGGGRINAAGAANVIQAANTVNGMGTTAANWPSIAAEILAAAGPLTQSDTINFGATKAFAVQKIWVAGSTTLTTLHRGFEDSLRTLLAIPTSVEVAALVPLGYPRDRFGPTRRKGVDEVTFVDRWGHRLDP